jgi:sugar/nucleoside kinase (ribokinase family)
MTEEAPGILCSGSIIYDTLVQPFDESAWGTTRWVQSLEYHVGGNGANTARALAILGISVRLLGMVGNDAQAGFVIQELQESGVDTTAIERTNLPTAATVVLVNHSGNRQFLHRLGASLEAFHKPIEFNPETHLGCSHYHLASLFLLPKLRVYGPEMLHRAREAGLTTSLDTNWDADGEWMRALGRCLPHLDILFMNEDEAFMLTGSKDPAIGAEVVLREGVRTAVMKLGGRGCAIYTEGHEITCPAFEVKAIDTTGAGDCFVAGFLSARQRGASWGEAGRFGNAVAALSVQKLGAVTGVLPWQETETWMKTASLGASAPLSK